MTGLYSGHMEQRLKDFLDYVNSRHNIKCIMGTERQPCLSWTSVFTNENIASQTTKYTEKLPIQICI
jgi:hypothetical protein